MMNKVGMGIGIFTFRLQRYNIYAKYANVWAKILRDSAKLAFYGNSNTSKNRFIYSRGALVGCFGLFWGGQNTFCLLLSRPYGVVGGVGGYSGAGGACCVKVCVGDGRCGVGGG